ncbi:MAG: hypothetical protein ACLT3Y_03715 [Ruminococcus callidus]
MRSAKPVKRVLLGLLVLCILLAGGWYLLTPFPIGKAMHADEPFSLSVVTAGVSVTGKATTESVTYDFSRNKGIRRTAFLLDGYTYHRSFLTPLPLESYTMDIDTTSFLLRSGDQLYQVSDCGDFTVSLPPAAHPPVQRRLLGQGQGTAVHL